MTKRDLAPARLHHQGIAGDGWKNPDDVVRFMGAVQAQDYAGAKWALGMRMRHATDDAVEMAIAHKAIVRTWALRGTLHLVTAEDIRWILTLVAPEIIRGNARRYRELELDEPTMAAAETILVRSLRDGRQLIRGELAASLRRAGISPAGQRMVYMLQRASLDRLICFGERRGREFTHTLLDEWAPAAGSREPDQALAELAERYFASHGPATLQDFTWWSGLPAADARRGLESVKGKLLPNVVDGATFWQAPRGRTGRGQAPPAARRGRAEQGSPAGAWLLPCFDEYVVGYKDRSAILDARHMARSGNGLLHPTIAVGGRIAGTWKRTIRRNEVAVSASPFSPFSRTEARGVAAAVTRYGDFLGMPAVLS
jgi:hypothetical protein